MSIPRGNSNEINQGVDMCRLGMELSEEYFGIAEGRLNEAIEGFARVRPDVPVAAVNKNMSVAKLPKEFSRARRRYQKITGVAE